MTTFDRLKQLCDEQKISIVELEEKLNFGRNSLYGWKKKIPNGANLQKVADYFNISVDYLLGRTDEKETSKPYYVLTEKDERDIAKDLERILSALDSDNALAFHGELMDEETKRLFSISLENSMRLAKEMAKKKFTPKKYRNE